MTIPLKCLTDLLTQYWWGLGRALNNRALNYV